jgi:hypothetical protein
MERGGNQLHRTSPLGSWVYLAGIDDRPHETVRPIAIADSVLFPDTRPSMADVTGFFGSVGFFDVK